MRKLRCRLSISLICVATALCAQQSNEAEKELDEAGKLFAAGNFSGVVAKLSPWADKFPNLADLHHGLGLAYYQQNFPAAIRHRNLALKNEKQDSPAWWQTVQILGMAYYFSRRWTEAAPLLEKACAWSLGDSTLFYTLGMSHLYSHGRDQARQAFAKFLRCRPTRPGRSCCLRI